MTVFISDSVFVSKHWRQTNQQRHDIRVDLRHKYQSGISLDVKVKCQGHCGRVQQQLLGVANYDVDDSDMYLVKYNDKRW